MSDNMAHWYANQLIHQLPYDVSQDLPQAITGGLFNWIDNFDTDGRPPCNIPLSHHSIPSIGSSDNEDNSNDDSDSSEDATKSTLEAQGILHHINNDDGNRGYRSGISTSRLNQGPSPYPLRVIRHDDYGRFRNHEYIAALIKGLDEYTASIKLKLDIRIRNRKHQPEGESTIQELLEQGMRNAAVRFFWEWEIQDSKERARNLDAKESAEKVQKMEARGAEARLRRMGL